MKTLKRYKKLSTLLRLALKDLARAERSKRYVINMGTWHEPVQAYDASTGSCQETGKCQVCLAGSVIAGTLNADLSECVEPCDYEVGRDCTTVNKLYALNSIRQGHIQSALQSIGRLKMWHAHKTLPSSIDVTKYESDPKLWRRQMNNIIKLLKRHGE
jgi:hypothetical protein